MSVLLWCCLDLFINLLALFIFFVLLVLLYNWYKTKKKGVVKNVVKKNFKQSNKTKNR